MQVHGSKNDAKFSSRIILRGERGIEWGCGPKHMNELLKEYGLEGCKGQETPMTKDRVANSSHVAC